MAFNAKVILQNVRVDPVETRLEFYADYADDRNKEWAANTPSLLLNMSISNELQEKLNLEIGQKFTLTFEQETD